MEHKDERLSVDREIREHYDIVKQFRDDLLADNEDPNAVVKALAAMTSIIRDVVKVQNQLYNAEKHALLQQTIFNVLKEYDPKIHEEVIVAFAADVERMNAETIQ